MITRIPQPQFVGPAPSEVQIQTADLGQRQLAIFQQALQEGAKNYLAQKEMAQQKSLETAKMASAEKMEAQREQSEVDKLRFSELSKSLMDDATKRGAATSFLDRTDEYKQLANYYSNGNKDLSKSLMESYAKSLSTMKGSEMAQRGMFSVTPGAPPATGAMPPGGAAAPAQTPGPPGSPPMGAAQSGAQGGAQLSHPLPENANEMSTEIMRTIAGNSPLMDEYRKTFAGNAKVLGHGTPEQNFALLGNTKNAFAKFASGLSPEKMASLVGTTQGGSAQDKISTMVSTMVPATSQGLRDTAEGVLTKIMTGAPADPVSGKESAALDRAVTYNVKVLEDSQEVKDFKAAGGTDEALQRGAAQYQEAMKDPAFVHYAQTVMALPPDQVKDYLDQVRQDQQFDKTMAVLGFDLKKQEDMQANAARAAQLAAARDAFIYEKMFSQSKDANTRAALDNVRSLTEGFGKLEQTERDAFRTANKGISDYDVGKHMWEQESTKGTNLYESRKAAANAWYGVTGVPPDLTEVTLAAVPGGLFGIGGKPAQKYQVWQVPDLSQLPVVPPQGGGTAAPPAPAASGAGPGNDYASKHGF